MCEILLTIVIKFYSEIKLNYYDGFGILLLIKDDKTLYIKQIHNKICYYTKGKESYIGINKCFEDNEIFLSIGKLNSYISDIKKKSDFFNEVIDARTNFYKKSKSA